MTTAVGIDLGTTNSAIAVKRLTATLLRNREGQELTPSCVTALPDGTFAVGRAARDLLKQYPQDTVVSAKRFMGRRLSDPDVQKAIKGHRYGYQLQADVADADKLLIPLRGQGYTPEAIAAMVLRKVVADGAVDLGAAISQVVVTVPAYFSDRQKHATRAACDQAGLTLLRLLPEPTAAAIAFGLEDMAPTDAKTVMVFDLGGGTFDISILSIAGGQFMEITKGGDMWLGGDDIDQMIVDHVYSETAKTLGGAAVAELVAALSASDRARFVAEMKESCERAKIDLSQADSAVIEHFGTLRNAKGKLIDIDVTLSRHQLDAILAPLVSRLTTITEGILQEIAFEPDLIDQVLMVGGSSMIPVIQEALRAKFGAAKVHVHPRPMFAIAEGAAIMAHRLAGVSATDGAMSIMHSTAHDYYLQLANGQRHRLIARNTPLPCRHTEQVAFKAADQQLARLRILNEIDGVLEPVGEVWVHRHGGDPLQLVQDAAAVRELSVTLEVDEDNILGLRSQIATSSTNDAAPEPVVTRGGASARLYAELEDCLARIAASARDRLAALDFVRLSRVISDGILASTANDRGAKLGEDALRTQIDTLRALAQVDSTAYLDYNRLGSLLRLASAALKPEESEAAVMLAAELRALLMQLTDAEAIDRSSARVDDLFDDLPDSINWDQILNLVREEHRWPGDGRRLREGLRKLGEARRSNDELAIEAAASELNAVASQFTSDWPQSHSGWFERDVVLAGSAR